MDFYDKLITAIVCVILTFICVFNTFCFASEEIDFSISTKIDNLTFGSFDMFYHDKNNQFCCFYLKVDPQISYTLNSSQPLVFSTSQELPANLVEFSNFSTSKLENFQVTGVNYLVVRLNQNDIVFPSDILKISYELNGLNFAVNSLVENVGINNIWNTFEISLPYVGVVVLTGFGFYLIFHNIKELSKGREKMN